MRIAIDAFNLGLLQGTGLATYSRELSHALKKAGHDVYPIYGLSNVKSNKNIAWPDFIQKLSTKGESSKEDYLNWGFHALQYFPYALFPNLALKLNPIQTNADIDINAIQERLPSFESIYNKANIFRVAQSYAALFNRSLTIENPGNIDIFHLTMPLPIKMKGVKTVITVHDIIPLMLPHSTKMNLRHYEKIMRLSLQQADIIFCISQKTQQDVIKWFNIPEEKTHLTYQAVNIPEKYQNLSDEAISNFLDKNYNLQKNGYFLYFGAIEPKKNVARIIDAMSMANTDLPLVIAGKDGWLFNDVKTRLENINNKKIIRLKYLSFSNLAFLIKGARALIFPSLYEGFGLPVLEAMQLGCPVITSNTTSLIEIAGDAALTVNPYDTHSISEAIEQLSKNDSLRKQLIEKGFTRKNIFSTDEYLNRLSNGYSKIKL